jgi:hypothetical protein
MQNIAERVPGMPGDGIRRICECLICHSEIHLWLLSATDVIRCKQVHSVKTAVSCNRTATITCPQISVSVPFCGVVVMRRDAHCTYRVTHPSGCRDVISELHVDSWGACSLHLYHGECLSYGHRAQEWVKSTTCPQPEQTQYPECQ